MKSFRNQSVAALTAAVALALLSTGVRAESFTFGVMADTQDTMGTGVNTVSTNIINAVNQQFIAKGVSFVVQVGDLGDNGSTASLQTRLDYTAALTSNGIPFYGLRGNHEDNGAGQTFFNTNYIPTTTASTVVSVMPGTSNYTVTYKNTKIVLLDILTADTPAALSSATTWMNTELTASDHSQAFVFQHKNLLGQNHKDNEFGSGNDSNTANQNAFISVLQSNGVRYDISGHDHMDHRAMVTSPDGQSKVQELICASDSTKFYAASSGFSTRETVYSDQQGTIGYYTFTVDGPRVTGRYFTTPKTTSGTSDGDITANPVWTLAETFGYSTNGKQFTIARGASYGTGATPVVQDAIPAGGGYQGTSMKILGGSNITTATAEGSRAVADDVNTGWTAKGEVSALIYSDVLTLWGMANGFNSAQTDNFALSLTVDASAISGLTLADGTTLGLVTKDAGGNWVNAVSLNFGGDGGLGFVAGAYNSSYGLGTYGFDAATDTAWAVINHNSDYAIAVVATPEPASLAVLALGGLALLARRRKA